MPWAFVLGSRRGPAQGIHRFSTRQTQHHLPLAPCAPPFGLPPFSDPPKLRRPLWYGLPPQCRNGGRPQADRSCGTASQIRSGSCGLNCCVGGRHCTRTARLQSPLVLRFRCKTLVQAFVAESIVEAFNVRVLPRTSRVDVEVFYSLLGQAVLHGIREEFRTVIRTKVLGRLTIHRPFFRRF